LEERGVADAELGPGENVKIEVTEKNCTSVRQVASSPDVIVTLFRPGDSSTRALK
jgi:hypothetical protein